MTIDEIIVFFIGVLLGIVVMGLRYKGKRDEDSGSLIVDTISTITEHYEWQDYYRAWYKPSNWLNSRRAACVFIAMKIKELEAKCTPDE